jgi:hypothetical protein
VCSVINVFCCSSPQTAAGRHRLHAWTGIGSVEGRRRHGAFGDPGIAVQYSHEQLVMPLTIPAQRLAQPALMAEAAFLIDPLGPRVEVIDTEAYPVQANGAQRVVDDEPGDLGSVTLTEQLRPSEPDTIVG